MTSTFTVAVPNPIDRDSGRWVPHEMGSVKILWKKGKHCDGERKTKALGGKEI